MKTSIRTRGVTEGDELRPYVERRLRFAFGRFAARVDEVIVRLTDVNGPRGGDGMRCRVEARLRGLAAVVVEDRASNLRHAIDLALARAGRSVARELARRREPRRVGAGAWN